MRLATASNELVSSIAICAGSGGSTLANVSADVYLTGEMSHHEVLEAVSKGSSVILCEHTNTERGYLSEVLKPKLLQLLGDDVVVECSHIDMDPLCIV